MTPRILRQMVKIDADKCNGCGACVPACAEGALQIIDGKAKLVDDKYCDGLGACLGECPQGAISVEARVAEEFDEEAVKLHLEKDSHTTDELPCGCPAAAVIRFEMGQRPETAPIKATSQQSMLSHWPVQLTLVPPAAPFLQGADVVLAADCVPFAYAGFHQELLKNHSLLVACPKLDDHQAHLKKLADILRLSSVKSLTVVHMEVACCSGLAHMAKQAMHLSGRAIALKEVIIGIKGDLRNGQAP